MPLYDIAQKEGLAEILPTIKTPIFGYTDRARPHHSGAQGPAIAVKVTNALPATHPQWGYEAWTSTHLHGSASKPQYDGYASDITRPGEYKDYHYPNSQYARTLWYHDHGVHHTAENAYMGLAALYLLGDDVEDRLPIPQGATTAGRLTDKMFAADGKFMYTTRATRLYGDVILVNGAPVADMKVARRKYRFRILNGSLSRGLRLRLSDRQPDHRHRHRRRPDARPAADRPAPSAWPSATRSSSTSPSTSPAPRSSCSTPACPTPMTSTTPTR